MASACVLVAAILLVSAWGSFQTSGQYAGQPRASRLSLGIALYAGFAVAIITLTALLISGYQSLHQNVITNVLLKQYVVDQQGRVLIRQFQRDGETLVTDLKGKQIARVDQYPNLRHEGINFLSFTQIVSPYESADQRNAHYGSPDHYAALLQSFLYHHEDTVWFYDYDAGQAIGYQMQSRRVAGFLGPHGFAGTSEAAGRFSEPLLSSIHKNNTTALLFFKQSAYEFNTDAQTLQKVWPASGTDTLASVAYLPAAVDARHPDESLIITSGSRLSILNDAGNLIFVLPYETLDGVKPTVSVARLPQSSEFLFWYSVNGYVDSNTAKIITVSEEGKVLKTVTLPALNSVPQVSRPQLMSAFGVLIPPALEAYEFGMAAASRHEKITPFADPSLRLLLLASLLMGLASAALAALISRRCGDGRRGQIVWAFGVFWLGAYGVLMLLALRPWPVRLPCPNCKRLRAVDRVLCEHCRAAWPVPLPDGTEIRDAETYLLVPASQGPP